MYVKFSFNTKNNNRIVEISKIKRSNLFSFIETLFENINKIENTNRILAILLPIIVPNKKESTNLGASNTAKIDVNNSGSEVPIAIKEIPIINLEMPIFSPNFEEEYIRKSADFIKK